MNTQEMVSKLRLMADTIEELEIDNIICCEVVYGSGMAVHLHSLKLTNAEAIWKERFVSDYPWEKSCTHNNIRFYALYTQEEYDREKKELCQ